MKKKLLAVTLSMVMCFAVTACGEKETEATVETTESVVETIEESDIVEESVIGEETTVEESTEVETATEESTEATESTEESTEASDEAAVPQISVEVPEGFEEQSEGVYMNMEDGANIMYITYEGAGGEFPEEDAFVEEFKASLADEAEVTVDTYEKTTVCGYDALRISMTFNMDGTTGTQTQIMITSDTFYGIVAFTQQGDAWTDTFEECIKTITIE